MGQRTPLYDAHLASNAKIVDFGGWDMPIHYGSQLKNTTWYVKMLACLMLAT